MSIQHWQDTCSCGSTRFWRSKVRDYLVCYECSRRDPLLALIVLARRGGQAAVRRAESWAADPAVLVSTSSLE
jgi:hypothetical protein